MDMTPIDWWHTGRNNAISGKYRYGYWPPEGVGLVRGVFYRAGWLIGKLSPR